MTTAQRITKRMNVIGAVRTKDSIFSVFMDGDTAVCHTEATLDTWWNSLAPEDKAALYELHLEGALDEPETYFTACGISPAALERPEFVAAMSTVAKAGQIMMAAQAAKVALMMQSAREVLDARGAAIHG